MAVRHGDLLIEEAERSDVGWSWHTIAGGSGQTGFSHGAAGVAWALLELWQVTSEVRFRCAAMEGFRFERACFDAERRRWADFREGEPRYESVWCHGSAGIGLARLRAWEILGDPELLAEARIALADVCATLIGLDNFSQCHGTAGCADVLLEGARITADASYLSAAEEAARHGIERFDRTGRLWPGGMIRATQTPDLMWGTAGIAWFYLRMADAGKTPTVLLPGNSEITASAHR
jgi:lantibiotic modifying enzyme